MSRAIIVVLALICAFIAGTATAGYAITHWLELGGRRSGPWLRFPAAWQFDADPYAHAFEHVIGHFPLGSAEGLVFSAAIDSTGQKLHSRCNYTVSGEIPAVRLFTLQAKYFADQNVDAMSAETMAIHSDQMLFGSKDFSINAAVNGQPDNWLQLKENEPFQFILTYYDVAVINDDTGNSIGLPQILKGRCQND